jgi:hypothetical protein
VIQALTFVDSQAFVPLLVLRPVLGLKSTLPSYNVLNPAEPVPYIRHPVSVRQDHTSVHEQRPGHNNYIHRYSCSLTCVSAQPLPDFDNTPLESTHTYILSEHLFSMEVEGAIELAGDSNPLTEGLLIYALEGALTADNQRLISSKQQLEEWAGREGYYALLEVRCTNSQCAARIRHVLL